MHFKAHCQPRLASRGRQLLAGLISPFPFALLAAESSLTATDADSAWLWNLVIALVVLVFTLASAVLPVAAWQQWRGPWRVAAGLPLAVLLAWVALIGLSRYFDPGSHRLWPFEIFAWAMLNMIYMVAAMTTKRILAKADEENPPSI